MGTVRARDEKNINRDMATGESKYWRPRWLSSTVQMFCRLTLNHVNTEEARLKYRYLDRRPGNGSAPENPR